jgi:Tfp pilus assembly protein PilO
MTARFRPPRRWVVLFAGCSALALALWVFLYALPAKDTLRSVRGELGRATAEYEHIRENTRDLPRARTALTDTRDALEACLGQLPPEAGLPDLGRNLARRATGQGLRVKDATFDLADLFPSETEDGPLSVTRLPFRMQVVGSFVQVGRFLEEVSRLDAVEVDAVTLERSSENPDALEGDLEMKLYALARGTEASGAAGGTPDVGGGR